MSKTHLHPEAGGDPAQGPPIDLVNESLPSRADNDFPDAPQGAADEKPQDKPDLDAFAKRMGTDTIESEKRPDAGEASTPNVGQGRRARLIILGGGAVLAGLLWLVTTVRTRR